MAILCLRLFLSFMKIGFFSFGGMTMIPVINDEVLAYGWMNSSEVMDIVAIAEMTPGSLGINCATFVGLRTAGIAGAFFASLGVMVPSLTICMLATHFIIRLKGNPVLESALKGIRPACMGMLLAVVITLSQSTFFTVQGVSWNMVLIAVIAGVAMFRFKLSIPKSILLAAALGLFIG